MISYRRLVDEDGTGRRHTPVVLKRCGQVIPPGLIGTDGIDRLFFLLTRLEICDRLYSVENVKVFVHLLSGGDNDFGDPEPYWEF